MTATPATPPTTPDSAPTGPTGPTGPASPSSATGLGTADQLGLWANLGVSLLLPVAATFLVVPGRSLALTLLAVVVGAVLGSLLLGLAAAAGARTGAPAMVLMRGLLGARLSALPTAANLVQCVGWATFEVFIIAEVTTQLTGGPRWLFVLLAGVVATAMALRPLGVVKVLARYAVWLALVSTLYLLVQVLRQPLPSFTAGDGSGFWTSVDLVIALPISWLPLAADYARHSRSERSAFVGASVGYGLSTIAFFSLGVLALVAYGLTPGFDVISSLLALPAAGLAVLILVVDELDEAFANLYSTAVSAQNVVPRADRRVLVVGVGVLATVLALSLDVYGYEPFLFLLGAVFVPLGATFLVSFYVLGRGRDWAIDDQAPARPLMLLPWAAGFVAYQLAAPTLLPGWAGWWTTALGDLGAALHVPTGWSASLVSVAVAGGLTLLVGLVESRLSAGRARRSWSPR